MWVALKQQQQLRFFLLVLAGVFKNEKRTPNKVLILFINHIQFIKSHWNGCVFPFHQKKNILSDHLFNQESY